MPGNKELDQAAAQLSEVRLSSEQHQQTVAQVLDKYSVLMEDYKRLRSDYEEERDSRERYKQMARGHERDPFVLVLIDGDGYIFDDDLISNGTDGGQKAARLLNEAVKSSLRNRGLNHCRIIVRIYANLAGLSKALYKIKLVGPEKRSLATFAASFNRSNELFDFVDAGDLKENADQKIRAMFRQFIENAQCRHVYFACCHDVGYLSELTPYSGNSDRITLVRTPALHHEFFKLGLRIEEFPNIFRTTPLEDHIAPTSLYIPPFKVAGQAAAVSGDAIATICEYHQKGKCKYGTSCHDVHSNSNTNEGLSKTRLSYIQGCCRQNSAASKNASSPQMHHDSKVSHDLITGDAIAPDPEQRASDVVRLLPSSASIPRNAIPININEHRLDPYIPPSKYDEKAAFQRRIAVKKLCNSFHLHGDCPNEDNCEYDHSPISQPMLNCLKTVVRNYPCRRKGPCRLISCMKGHVCQKPDCMWYGGKQHCKFDADAHSQPLKMSETVLGMRRREHNSLGSNKEASSRGVTSPVPRAGRSQYYSDADREPQQGALLDFDDDSSGSLFN